MIARLLILLILCFSLGCASQRAVQLGKTITLPNGDLVAYYGIEDKSRQGLVLKTTDRAICKQDGTCDVSTINIAASDGIADKVLQGLGPAAAQAGGLIGAAALLRPPTYKNKESVSINQQQAGGGAKAEADGGEHKLENTSNPVAEFSGNNVEGGDGGVGGQGGSASSSPSSTSTSYSEGGNSVSSSSAEGGNAHGTGGSIGDITLKNNQTQNQDQHQGQHQNNTNDLKNTNKNYNDVDVKSTNINRNPVTVKTTINNHNPRPMCIMPPCAGD